MNEIPAFQPSFLVATPGMLAPVLAPVLAHPDEGLDVKRKGPKREYTCDVCLKMFSCSSNLKRHMSVHTGYKPYTCQFCHMAFSNSSNRRKHERSHSRKIGDDPSASELPSTNISGDNSDHKSDEDEL